MRTKNFVIKKRGSVLIFSLFIMMISLIIGISLMSTSAVGRKSSLSSTKSVNSFQIADSGIEYAYATIRQKRWDRPGNVLDGTENLKDFFDNCTEETIGATQYAMVEGSANGGTFKLYFKGGTTPLLDIQNCTAGFASIENIKKIKSIGEYNGIIRSVEVTVNFADL